MTSGSAVVELSHLIEDGMRVYPGDPQVRLAPALSLPDAGVAVTALSMGSHTGTHVDAPAHSIMGGRTMATVTVDELVGEALVLRVRGLEERQRIDWALLESSGPVPAVVPSIVVIDTDWARWFYEERSLRHPYLEPSAAAELLHRGMHVLAVDTLSPDATGSESETLPVHELVLGADCLIIENLTGLGAVPDRVRVGFFPLRIDGDGAPVRAVAFVEA